MKSGTLRHRVTLQQAGETTNALNERVQSWSDFQTVWAAFSQNQSLVREELKGDHLRGVVPTQITIRYLAGVTREMRVKFGDRYFRIENVYNWQERNRMMVLTASEVMEAETP